MWHYFIPSSIYSTTINAYYVPNTEKKKNPSQRGVTEGFNNSFFQLPTLTKEMATFRELGLMLEGGGRPWETDWEMVGSEGSLVAADALLPAS